MAQPKQRRRSGSTAPAAGPCPPRAGAEPAPRLLLIEDDAAVRDALTRSLARAGFEVTAVDNGRDGISAFDGDPPDVVVTDVLMAETDGIEVVRHLAHAAPGVPVVAISGNPDYLRHCRAFGAAEAVRKPFPMSALLDAIVGALDRAA